MTLGQRITQYRTHQHLSQLELAEQLQVSRQSVSKWETDTSVPELAKLVELSQIFHCTLDELVTGAEPIPPQTPPQAPPQQGRATRDTLAIALLITGIVTVVMGFLIPLAWLVSIPCLLVGLYLLNPEAALVFCWWLLLIPLVLLRQITSVSLGMVFNPILYGEPFRLRAQLAIAFLLWALIITWTVCAVKSKQFQGHPYIAIGWGLVLTCCDLWLSCVFFMQHLGVDYFSPLEYLRIAYSLVLPVVVIIATVRLKISEKRSGER